MKYLWGIMANEQRKLSVLEMHRLSPGAYKESAKIPLVLVLDNVRSMNNIGSLFRTADAFRIEALYLCGITACPPHPMIHKTALGAEESVSWRYFSSTMEAVEDLRRGHYLLTALEQTTHSVLPQPYNSLLCPEHRGIALLVGNEVHGVEEEAIAHMDYCIEIPQYGTKHSLNVSVAAGIALYELVRESLSTLSGELI